MIRLRSDRWYSSDGQRRSRSSVAGQALGNRRVISLCFLLALVILLMQQAADPQHVRNAFQALGVPFERRSLGTTDDIAPSAQTRSTAEPIAAPLTSDPSTGQTEAGDQRSGGSGADAGQPETDALAQPKREPSADETRWLSVCRDLIPRLLADASDAQLSELGRRWFAVAPNLITGDPNLLRTLSEASETKLLELRLHLEQSASSRSERQAWETQLSRFGGEWQSLCQALIDQRIPVETDPSLAATLTAQLDQRLLAILEDGSPWKKSETVPFLRLLQAGADARRLATADIDPPLVGTLQLEAEHAAFRGSPIRYRGSVRRVEYVEREANPLGISAYWLLWLRGADGAAQPVAVYTTAAIAKQLQAAVATESFPEIEVAGALSKRLAYASPAGVEVAPTIFAHSILQFVPDTIQRPIAPPAEQLARFGWALSIGLLTAVVILLPILANWRRSGPRTAAHQRKRSLSRRNTTATLILAALASSGSWTALARGQQPSPAEQAGQAPAVTPPWARSEGQLAAWDLLSNRLNEVLTPAAVEEIERFIAGELEDFPDSALKTMHTLRQLGWDKVLRDSQPSELAAAPLAMRASHLTGMVRLAMPISLSDQQQMWFQADSNQPLYRLEVEVTQLDNTPQADARPLMTVFCTRIPTAWTRGAQLRQPLTAHGLLLETTGTEEGTAQSLCLFAEQPGWVLAATASDSELLPPLDPQEQRLAELGWDLAYLDTVRENNQQPLQANEAAGFYSLLRILSQVAPASQAVQPMDVLAHPTDQIGVPVDWQVRLVSGSIVEVAAPRDRQTLGAERYIQYDGFVDIGNQTVRYQVPGAEGPEIVEFKGEFPVTLVTLNATPFGKTSAGGAEELSWKIGQYARVAGGFYRLWSYESELIDQSSRAGRQAAPLVIARSLTLTTPPIRVRSSSVGWFGYALCIATLAVLGGILYSAFHRQTRRRPTRL